MKKAYTFEYMIVCALHVVPYVGHPRPFKNPLYVYQTKDMNLKLPWDETYWDEMQVNKEFDDLCKKIEKNQKLVK